MNKINVDFTNHPRLYAEAFETKRIYELLERNDNKQDIARLNLEYALWQANMHDWFAHKAMSKSGTQFFGRLAMAEAIGIQVDEILPTLWWLTVKEKSDAIHSSVLPIDPKDLTETASSMQRAEFAHNTTIAKDIREYAQKRFAEDMGSAKSFRKNILLALAIKYDPENELYDEIAKYWSLQNNGHDKSSELYSKQCNYLSWYFVNKAPNTSQQQIKVDQSTIELLQYCLECNIIPLENGYPCTLELQRDTDQKKSALGANVMIRDSQRIKPWNPAYNTLINEIEKLESTVNAYQSLIDLLAPRQHMSISLQ